MYRAWLSIVTAGLLGGVAVVSLFAGFGSPVFLGVAAVSAGGGLLAYRYGRERMLRSVYAGVENGPRDGMATEEEPDERDDTGGGRRATQATDGGETTVDGSTGYDDWTWAGRDPDDPFWSDDPGDWEDPWAWEATDPEDAGANGWRRGPGAGDRGGSERWSGWSDWTGGEPGDGTDGERDYGRHDDRTTPGEHERGPTVAEAYEVLGLEPGADLEAVRRAYRERAKETHPDLGGDPEVFIEVREAYERLRERLGGGE